MTAPTTTGDIDRRIIEAIKRLHRHSCRIYAYRIAMRSEVPVDDVTKWLNAHGLWYNRFRCRIWGEWLIEHPSAFESVRDELGGIFRESEYIW